MPLKHFTAVMLTCLFVLMAAEAAQARPLVRGYGCAVADHDTILELVECFGEPLYTEEVEEYIRVRPRHVVKTTITIWYYRIDESGFNNNELFAFHIHQGKIFKIEQISK
ncbi:MAG: hypothetical protein R6U41_10335 [Desulfosalsimonas sp.]|uniref:hypothetical protein n=1 Tax=Desulfosalsimonas sp. TaxID=3073848 RepID=UPI003970BAD2